MKITMPRQVRKQSELGLYHVMLRGNNKQVIFQDDDDYRKLLFTLYDCRLETDLSIYAYCIMSNHIHLLINERTHTMSDFIKRVAAKYVLWYNTKYERCGHLFQGRFRSEPIQNTYELYNVMRYIHQNPYKAGIESEISSYRWSSYQEYMGMSFFCETDWFLNLISENRSVALESFQLINHAFADKDFIDIDDKLGLSDSEALHMVSTRLKWLNLQNVMRMSKEMRLKAFNAMFDLGLSIRQISRLTGFSYGTVRNNLFDK
ncbi:MAG TPA: transposase [Clostridiales bacterium UBA8960]|nr:transposase [Clostridiales bacterium UBA8960]